MKQSVRDKLRQGTAPELIGDKPVSQTVWNVNPEPSKVTAYAILICPFSVIVEKVGEQLAEGWQPIGGASQTSDGRVMQAMVRHG